ncbi:MAG: hypothetical protein FJ221_14730 [Lentisphaerae bacterium]|nr:hypothetical protein [Lentisphaerota bacterium]
MNPEALEALVVDRELGELSPEAADLLEAYLRLSPEARASAGAMAAAVGVARATVRNHPGLAPIPRPGPVPLPGWTSWLARAAAAVLLLGGGIWIGRRAEVGSAGIPAGPAVAATGSPAARAANPWARYQVAYDARRGAYTVARHP